MNKRAIFGFSLGPIGVGIISFASLPIMAWIFSPEMIGKLSMIQVAIGFAIVSCCLGLDQAYGREYHEASNQALLFLNVIVPGLIILLSILGVFFLFGKEVLSVALFDIHSSYLSIIAAVCLVAAYVVRFLSLILRMQNRGIEYSVSQMLAPLVLLFIVLGYAIFSVHHTFQMLLMAQAIALLSAVTAFGWLTRRSWLPATYERLNFFYLRRLLTFGIPLAFSGIAFQGAASLDRILLRSFSNYEELAVYSVAASIASGITIVASIFNTIWAPMVYKWLADEVKVEDKVDKVSSIFSIVMILLLCLAGGLSWILDYILPKSYSQVKFLVVGCMVSPMFYTFSEVTGIGIAITRRTIFSLAASISAVGINAVLGYLLVMKLGAVGAVISTSFSFYLFFVLRTEFSNRLWRRINRRTTYGYSFLCLLLSCIYVVYGNVQPILIVMLWWFLLFYIFYIHRSNIFILFKYFRSFLLYKKIN